MAQIGRGFQFALTWLIMAALCGLVGFLIIYHYTSFDRPTQHFAIVIDAGSTQTRSSLFTIQFDSPKSSHQWSEELSQSLPLNKLLQVRQVSSCTNGGPLSALQSPASAKQLVNKCFNKFVQHIKKLDFIETHQPDIVNDAEGNDDASIKRESAEISDQMALVNHRVNSLTHVYLGATAGMRALAQVNATRAHEKILWVDRALDESRYQVEDGPFINKGHVDIIKGSDEAAFGWLSVNFVCERLNVAAPDRESPKLVPSIHRASPSYGISPIDSQDAAGSVGTLEMGGASIQMAYQIPEGWTDGRVSGAGLEPQTLDLFNRKYRLATRSDLCLGMSKAVLRNNYALMRDHYSQMVGQSDTVYEIPNPCLQRASRLSFSGQEISSILRGACLSPSKSDMLGDTVRDYLINRQVIRFVGTGDTQKCNLLLNNLLEPQLCRRYFSLCPDNANNQAPPEGMPFVTISGYNKAMQTLNLTKLAPFQDHSIETNSNELVISEKLGGYSINHEEFVEKTREFCQLDISEFPSRFPKMRSNFYATTCMNLLYINKILTEFYRFDPSSSWLQIKFLLFPVKSSQSSELAAPRLQAKQHDDKRDIGWALGLVLNATSEQIESGEGIGSNDILYHHGSTVMFVLRSTLFTMFACVLLAIAILVFSVVSVNYNRRRSSGSRYLNPAPSYGASEVTTVVNGTTFVVPIQ